jgi:hypothetical protein
MNNKAFTFYVPWLWWFSELLVALAWLWLLSSAASVA